MKADRVKRMLTVCAFFGLLLGMSYGSKDAADVANDSAEVYETELMESVLTETEILEMEATVQEETETEETEIIEIESTETELTEIETEETEMIEDDTLLAPVVAFKRVLENKKTFRYSGRIFGSSGSPDDDCDGYLKDVLNDKGITISGFAVVDMDGDGMAEIVLEEDNYKGFWILRYEAGEVIGYEVAYRGLMGLDRNGFFGTSSGAGNTSVGKMFFIGDFAVYDDITRQDYPDYYVKDIKVSEEVWKAANTAIGEIEETMWYTEDEIITYIINCPLIPETLEAVPVNEKQEYLNSLYYLMELASGSSEENYEEFYYACLEEMDKIYQLCVEKYVEEELRVLEKRQRRWQEDLDDRIAEDLSIGRVESLDEIEYKLLFLEYGDIVLKRVCNLVNEYYECEFYSVPD